MKIDNTFPSKLIIKTESEDATISFLNDFIKLSWLSKDTPDGMRKVKDEKKLTLDKLPKDFSIEDTARNSFHKGLLSIPKIGVVNMNINAIITKDIGIVPGYKVEVDRFLYERDGHSLKDVVDKIFKKSK